MARLTAAKRNSLPSSAFAEPKLRKYPLDTENRARDALSRVSANGTEHEKSLVRSAVKSRYPDIKVSK